LNTFNGRLGGTASTSGDFLFEVLVTDASGHDATQSFTLTVNPARRTPPASPLSILTSAIPPAVANRDYSASLSASGGQLPYQWSVVSGTLPLGIQLSSSSGLLSGTTSALGAISFVAAVTDASGIRATESFTLQVSADGPAVLPAQYFGMHIIRMSLRYPKPWGPPIRPPIVVGAMGKCSVSNWQYIEPTLGVYNWALIDTCTNWAAHFGIKYFESWQYMTPSSVGATDPATDPRCWVTAMHGIYSCLGAMTPEGEQQWINYNAAMALRYKGNPGMDFYEGWNEPPYAPKPRIPPITAAQLAQYERDRVMAIRANDPNAKVASPAFIIDPAYPSYAIFMDDFLGNNPPTYDYYDFHINYPNAPEDEVPLIAQFRQILAKHGVVAPAIYATEGGRGGSGIRASTDTCPAWPSNVTPDLQQAFIARMELLYWSQGIARHYWYAYDICGTLTDEPSSETLKPAGIAYGKIENWMIGATMSQACAGPAYPGKGVWTCALTKPGGTRTLAVWDSSQSCSDRNCTTSSYSYEPSYTKYYTLVDGTSTPLGGGTVQIGAKPVLLSQ
jgi:hypothetical protein